MSTFQRPMPPTRTTGDVPAAGVAGDVNLLTDAVAEVRQVLVSEPLASDAVLAQGLALPHVVVTTTSGTDPVTTKDYLDASVSISGAAPYAGTAQVRGRGNSTWHLPKKPWRIKLTAAASLLGMNPERDWVLLANHYDSTKLRGQIAFEIAGRCSGLAWTPRFRFVELTMNGTYRGVYQLGEHVERSDLKIPGAVATGTSGLPLTGVYTLEIDKRGLESGASGFLTAQGMAVCYDDPDGTAAEPATYIRQWITTFESALFSADYLSASAGYAQYIDMPSFVDWYIVNELLANLDANGYSSIKMFKTRDTADTPGRLVLGPVWDFDQALGNNSFGDPQSATAPWVAVPSADGEHPGFTWIARMLTDPTFFGMLASRWQALRATLVSGDTIASVIDRLGDRLTFAVARDRRRWSLAGDPLADADAMKTWLASRIAWLDTQWYVDIVAPSVPEGLTATPGNQQAVLTWVPATDNVGVTKYRVRVDGVAISPDPTTTSVTLAGLTNGTSYSATVSALDGAGNESAQSTATTFTPSATVVANTAAPTISGSAVQGQTLTTANGSWSPTPDSYTYQWRRAGSPISGATARTYVLTSDDVGKTLTVVVTAVKAGYASGVAASAATATVLSGALPTALIDIDPNTISAANGTSVASAPDVAGANRHFTQGSAAFQPVLVTNAINSRKALRFAQKQMELNASGISEVNEMTLCLVMAVHSFTEQRSGVLTAAVTDTQDFEASSGNFAVGVNAGASETSWASVSMTGGLTASNDVIVGNPGKAYGAFAIITIVAGRAGGSLRFFVNGTEQTATAGTPNTGALNLGRLVLGARYYNGAITAPSDMTLARMRLYSGRLNSAQLSTLHSQMGSAFGITVA